MPELVEVDRYRRTAERVVGCRIGDVVVVDPHVVRGEVGQADLDRLLAGRTVTAARRHGKLLLLDTDGPTLGMRFGMTGGLVLDGEPSIDGLLYSSSSHQARWVRFRMGFSCPGGDRRELVLHDPRRLGRIELDPSEDALGPDAATITLAELRSALGLLRLPAGGGRPDGPALKARLLDQRRLAGVGNLIADEVLWRAGLSPARPAAGLTDAELRRLHRQLRATIADLLGRGGSHTGDLMPERHAGGRCPKDGTLLTTATVGGRTSWWCPGHQR